MTETTSAMPCRVLVVEDDPASRHALLRLLKHRGWSTLAAETVSQALASLHARPACIILDLMLPDGNGAAVLRYIRANNLPIRVAVATGTHDPAMLSEVEALGPDALYRKPIDFEAVSAWLSAPAVP